MSDNIDMDKSCIGCNTYTPDLKTCGYFHKIIVCPCSICLIKPMCVLACELLINHSRILSEARRNENRRLYRV